MEENEITLLLNQFLKKINFQGDISLIKLKKTKEQHFKLLSIKVLKTWIHTDILK